MKKLNIPYLPLPLEIMPADSNFDVHLFAAGISTTITNFIQDVHATDRLARLSEEEWIARFTKFVEKQSRKRRRAPKR